MSKKLSTPAPSVASGKVPAPVRVRLKRVNCDQAIPYPPGQPAEGKRIVNEQADERCAPPKIGRIIQLATSSDSGNCFRLKPAADSVTGFAPTGAFPTAVEHDARRLEFIDAIKNEF